MTATPEISSWFVSSTAVSGSNNNSSSSTTTTKSRKDRSKKIERLAKTSNPSSYGLSLKAMVRASAKVTRPVKFDDREGCTLVVVHQLEPVEADPQELWFSKQEIKVIRAEGKITLAKVNQAGGDISALDEANGESIRGLEHGLSVHDREGPAPSNDDDDADAPLCRNQRRKNIVDTILCQQHEQREHGIDDPKGLQVTSKACTQWARDRAIEQGIKDFEDALRIWGEDPQCARLLPAIMDRKQQRGSFTRRNLLTMKPAPAAKTTSNNRPAAPANKRVSLNNISQSVASALEELGDLDF